ncbi:MAG TPA: helix-turn-helix domain-containing protein [Mycobacterium sp.]|nr:helix-turn-helix domain-containing protein [Mycobacterium sp.]
MTSATAPRPASKSVRDRLIDAAEVCLRAKGIRSTTVSEVAEVAGVSRGWLYRHFPDKNSLLGAAIVRLNDAYWSESHAMLERIDGLDEQIAAGIRHGRSAYADPGALLMKLRMEEPEEFAACAGAGVLGLVPDLGEFWSRYLLAARDRGEIHAEVNIAEASEWVARVLLSLATVPGHQLDPADHDAVLVHVRRYVMPGLRADPAPGSSQ